MGVEFSISSVMEEALKHAHLLCVNRVKHEPNTNVNTYLGSIEVKQAGNKTF